MEAVNSVLIVEGSTGLSEVFPIWGERMSVSFEMTVVNDYHSALHAIDRQEFDCVVTGNNLDEKSGITLIEEIRSVNQLLPVIMYSGEAEYLHEEAYDAGANVCIPKNGSHSMSQLMHQVEKELDRYHSARRSKRFEQEILESTSTEATALWAVDGAWEEVLYLDAAYEAVYGQQTELAREDPAAFLRVIQEDDRPYVRRKVAELLQGEEAEMAYRIEPDGDGEPVWVNVHAEGIQNGDTVERVVGVSKRVNPLREEPAPSGRERNVTSPSG
jgi:DNA-binding response OmpR family regulator